MSERLLTSSGAGSNAADHSARPERRESRRAGVSLRVRIRAADSNFEEFRTTLNASRKAVYFFTRVDRYCKGMRLRITSPYDDQPGVVNLEQEGEVVRVQAVPGGYGVAVVLLPGRKAATTARPPELLGREQATAKPNVEVTRLEIERRCASRSAFVAPVELIDMRTGSRIHARVADLSVRGCYIDTLNPLPAGSAVRLQIRRADEMFDALANVSSSHAGSGMGLVFADLALPQSEMLRSWLGESLLPPDMGFSAPQQASKRRRAGEADQMYALRLIHALVRKGILSKSEASELLADPDI
jgi:hypothetical protein